MIHKIHLIKQYWNKSNNYYGSFIIEPIELNQGITLANALRRTLLNDLSSFSITGFRVNDLKHEFSNLEGIKEDILELKSNLKEIIFKNSFNFLNPESQILKGILNIKGPTIITAGMIQLPKNTLKIINPTHYIGTLTNTANFILEMDIEKNVGYLGLDDYYIQTNNYKNNFHTFLIDTNFNPIINVNYKIKLIHDTKGHLKESIFLEITTNGSITPKRSLQEASKLILNLFYPLLLNSTIKDLPSQINIKNI